MVNKCLYDMFGADCASVRRTYLMIHETRRRKQWMLSSSSSSVEDDVDSMQLLHHKNKNKLSYIHHCLNIDFMRDNMLSHVIRDMVLVNLVDQGMVEPVDRFLSNIHLNSFTGGGTIEEHNGLMKSGNLAHNPCWYAKLLDKNFIFERLPSTMVVFRVPGTNQAIVMFLSMGYPGDAYIQASISFFLSVFVHKTGGKTIFTFDYDKLCASLANGNNLLQFLDAEYGENSDREFSLDTRIIIISSINVSFNDQLFISQVQSMLRIRDQRNFFSFLYWHCALVQRRFDKDSSIRVWKSFQYSSDLFSNNQEPFRMMFMHGCDIVDLCALKMFLMTQSNKAIIPLLLNDLADSPEVSKQVLPWLFDHFLTYDGWTQDDIETALRSDRFTMRTLMKAIRSGNLDFILFLQDRCDIEVVLIEVIRIYSQVLTRLILSTNNMLVKYETMHLTELCKKESLKNCNWGASRSTLRYVLEKTIDIGYPLWIDGIVKYGNAPELHGQTVTDDDCLAMLLRILNKALEVGNDRLGFYFQKYLHSSHN